MCSVSSALTPSMLVALMAPLVLEMRREVMLVGLPPPLALALLAPPPPLLLALALTPLLLAV